MPKQTISLCMITKNEEKFLEQCLNSVKDIVDEIIIVDTGSTDKTKEVAKDICKKFASEGKFFDLKFFDYKWSDDFSAARNESIRHATKDWVLVMDADEVLDEEGRKTIKELIGDKENDAFLFLQKNYANETSIAGFVNDEHKKDGKVYVGWYGSFIARLFRNKKGYEFEGTVHELVEPSIERKKGKIAATNIALHHYGNAEPSIAKKKREFYLELCKKKVKKEQTNVSEFASNEAHSHATASSYCELGILYKENNNLDDALGSFKKSIELNPKHSMALYELGVIYEKQKNYDEAIKIYTESLKIRENSEAFQNLGVCYLKKGMFKEAYRNLTKAMLLNPNKYTIYNNLGAVLEKIGNYESAIQMLEIAIKLNPNNTVGFYNLGIVLDKKGDFENVIKNYQKAVELGHSKHEEIKKRIRQLKVIVDNATRYGYGFKLVK